MKDSDKPKLVLAIVLLVVAGAVAAWYFGVFSSAPQPEVKPANAPTPAGGGRTAPGFKPTGK